VCTFDHSDALQLSTCLCRCTQDSVAVFFVNVAPSGYGKSKVAKLMQDAVKAATKSHSGLPSIVASCGTLPGLRRVAADSGGVAWIVLDELFGPLGNLLLRPTGDPDRQQLLTLLGSSQGFSDALADRTASQARCIDRVSISGLAFTQVW